MINSCGCVQFLQYTFKKLCTIGEKLEVANIVFRKLSPNLGVDDVDHTIKFYKEILGFELVLSVPEGGPSEWAVMKCGDVEMMFQSVTSLIEEIPVLKDKKIGYALNFYMEVEDIKRLYTNLKGKVTLVREGICIQHLMECKNS